MILITLAKDETGLIRSVASLGHASGAGIPACAAVSNLLRVYAMTLEVRHGVFLKGKAPNRGEFYCFLEEFNTEDKDWLAGVSDFLDNGLQLLRDEHPDQITLIYEQLKE